MTSWVTMITSMPWVFFFFTIHCSGPNSNFALHFWTILAFSHILIIDTFSQKHYNPFMNFLEQIMKSLLPIILFTHSMVKYISIRSTSISCLWWVLCTIFRNKYQRGLQHPFMWKCKYWKESLSLASVTSIICNMSLMSYSQCFSQSLYCFGLRLYDWCY